MTPAPNDTLKFEVGVPYTIAIQQPYGKPVASRFGGDQLLFSLIPNQHAPWSRMFVDSYVQQRLKDANVVPGEPFEIQKTEVWHGNRRVVSMEVRKIGATAIQAAAPAGYGTSEYGQPNHTPASLPVRPPPAASAQPNQTPAAAQGTTPIAPHAIAPAPLMNGAGETSAAILSRCYTQAIDIAVAATSYAETKGLRITPGFEDIRALAATICINETGRR